MIRPIEFFKNLIRANSGYSSKRFCALVLLFSGITIPVICLFMKPIGVLDDSVLLLALQLLASGCGLLGFTLGEKYQSPLTKKIEVTKTIGSVGVADEEVDVKESTTKRFGVECDNSSKG